MIQLNYRDSRPIYEQVKESFRKMIVSGAMEPNEKLPSVRNLASEMSINPNTIQRAYNELESEGLVYSIPGKGNFVMDKIERDEKKVNMLIGRLRETANELKYLGLNANELHEIEDILRGISK